MLCTFTNKAAYEMRDRLAAAAQKVGYDKDLSDLTISTIHGFCNQVLTKYRHHTKLGHNYEVLDELTQHLFISDHFDEIIGAREDEHFLVQWGTRRTAIENACKYFNKIAEEMVDADQMENSSDRFLSAIGAAYQRYEKMLFEHNRVDFAHLQAIAYDLLSVADEDGSEIGKFQYVTVDEYQDTNYIQEQLLLKLSERSQGLCVVGDEDQSLYRFRGATVRNILEFRARMPNSTVIKLTTNYRSHKAIVEKYDQWMSSADWSNSEGVSFRWDKTIKADTGKRHPDYPSIISIWGTTPADEAKRLSELVGFLKRNNVIEDYSQVAILLHSVRKRYSGHYLTALEADGIPAFCPRSREFFEIIEIQDMVACYAVLFGWYGADRGDVYGTVKQLADYVDAALMQLSSRFGGQHPLAKMLQKWVDEIESAEDAKIKLRPADYFYQLLALDPFKETCKDENVARNLAIFSRLLNVFQVYYHYTSVTRHSIAPLRFLFFNSFLRLLYEGGIDKYEDPDLPFPRGYVQVMTIHQAKGTEFPVVIVGSLSTQTSSAKKIDRDLKEFYHRLPFEPEKKITQFDRMRLHYVAFSRAQKILVLTSNQNKPPKKHFNGIWQGLPQWPYAQQEVLAVQNFRMRDHTPLKKVYSFTRDIKIYETCPRQYQYFREYDFTPSRSAVIFFGLLVHQCIEDIHRIVISGKLESLNKPQIRELFEKNFQFLLLSDVRPISDQAKERAFAHVINYFRQNRNEMRRVAETEVDVSLEKDGYILTGKVDLLLSGRKRKYDLLDFKASPRPARNPDLLMAYTRQLCTYAHIIDNRYGRRVVDRLLLYWTAERRKEDALMILPYHPKHAEEAGRHFDETVRRIQAAEFAIETPPDKAICKECDLRMLCNSEGVIEIPNAEVARE